MTDARRPRALPRMLDPVTLPLARRYAALSPQLRGMLLLLVATIGFAAMHAVIRHASSAQHPFEVAFFRNFFGLIVLCPFWLRSGLAVFRTERLPLHATRGVLHVSAMLCFFYAVPITPLSTIAALSFTAPLFVTIGAVVFLGEVVRARRITALLLGFIGAIVIIQPGFGALDLGALLVLCSSAIWASALLIIKALSRTESSLTLTAYMGALLTPLSLIAALPFWQWPSLVELGWFALMGAFGTVSHLCLAQAFREADASAVLPVDFLRLLWASVLGYVWFGEVPEVLVWVGGTIIFSSTLYLAYREAKLARAVVREPGGPHTPS